MWTFIVRRTMQTLERFVSLRRGRAVLGPGSPRLEVILRRGGVLLCCLHLVSELASQGHCVRVP